MKTLCVTVVMLLGSTLWGAAQSCPDLNDYLPAGNVCNAPANQVFWYHYLGDETDTYVWYVTGGTIISGGGLGGYSISVFWTPGAPVKQVAVEKWTQWGAYCSDVITVNCP